MKNIFKVFKAELYKLIINKKIWVFFTIFLLALFVFLIYSQNSFYTSEKDWEQRETLSGNINPSEYSADFRQQIIDEYPSALENAEQDLAQALETGTELEIRDFGNTVAMLKYLIKTKTIYKDYIVYNFIESMTYNYYGAPFLFQTFAVFKYIIVFSAVLLTTVIIIHEYKSGITRNIICCPVKREQILLGKMLFVFTIIFLLTAVCVVFSYGVALYYGCNPAYTLMVKDGVCYCVSVYSIFWRMVAGAFIISVLLSCTALFIGYLTNNHFVSLLFPFALYVVLYFVLQFLIKQGYDKGNYVYGYINYFPILNLNEQYIYFWSDFFIILLYNLLIAAAMLILSIYINKKKEY